MDTFDPDLFWDQVRGAGDCWVWTGARGANGYGFVSGYSFTERFAHRLAWTMANGPIPEGKWVLHTCDNPPCVNPAHLFLGSAKDNAQDRDRKGRDRYSRGHFPTLKAACIHGHPYDDANTVFGSRGQRECRVCRKASQRVRDARRYPRQKQVA
jgi:hypothetical protein